MDGNIHARRRWAFRMVERCQTPPPSYGSAEWLKLPEGDYRKVAAVVIAAEAWAVDGDNLEERLHAELAIEREAFKRAEDADYAARRDEHRAEWGQLRLIRGAYADSPRFLGHEDGGKSA